MSAPDGYAYVFVTRDGPRATVSWRQREPQAFERRHVLRDDASGWADDELRRRAAQHLGIPAVQAGRIELGMRD